MTSFVLIWLLAHGVPGPHAEAMAPCIAGYHSPMTALALMEVESNYQNERRSSSGACSYFQLLGGRYGNPTCQALEADHGLACRVAMEELDYWLEHCGAAWLDAWNGGWKRCWTDPKRKKCKPDQCKSFGKKVRKTEAWIRLVFGDGGWL